MNNDSFKTDEEREAAIPHFKSLLDHPGWKLFEQVVSGNIKVVEDQILSGVFVDAEGNTVEYTQEQMNRKRDELVVYKNLRDTPKMMVERLRSTEGEEPEFDPYTTREQLKKERGEKE